jgi:REP element-mobilizing transposase RayT
LQHVHIILAMPSSQDHLRTIGPLDRRTFEALRQSFVIDSHGFLLNPG